MYTKDLIQTTRPRAMYDNEIHTSEKSRYLNQSDQNVEKLTEQFKEEIDKWIHSHKRIKFTGLEQFPDRNVVLGVTQQLDDLHMQYLSLIHI